MGGTRRLVGCDRSVNLVDICVSHGHDALVCDNMHVPWRPAVFDAALSIAVLHHFSTQQRRVQAVREVLRVVAVGGRALFSAWALEQVCMDVAHPQCSAHVSQGEESRRDFPSQDVFVPWKLQPQHTHKATDPAVCQRSNKRMPCIALV